jgi:carbamoyltransferase
MIVGISFGYHDSAASAIIDNDVLFAGHEERYSRKKFDPSFPSLVLEEIDQKFGLENVESFVFHEKPLVKLERQLIQILLGGFRDTKSFPENISGLRKITSWNKKNLAGKLKSIARAQNSIDTKNIYYGEHHRSHAAATFFTSQFDEALVIISDAVGEWDSQSVWLGQGNKLNKIYSQRFPHSIGLFYSAMTYYLGFKVNSGEYKLMGLAPYGTPCHVEKIKEIIHLGGHGEVRLDLSKFSFLSGNSMTDYRLEKFFGRPRRLPSDPISQWHADMAASTQYILEEALTKLLDYFLSSKGAPRRICLGGGVALNCVASSKIANKYGPENLHIFPAAGDSGGAVGAAISFDINKIGLNNKVDSKRWSYNNLLLGHDPETSRCSSELKKSGLKYEQYTDEQIAEIISKEISAGSIIGIYHGREEFGPRALGNRSILADPQIKKGQITLNLKIKFRESFRPFAPIVLEEYANEWFDIWSPERFMTRTVPVKNFAYSFVHPGPNDKDYNLPINIEDRLEFLKSPIPAVTHLDNSSRIQTIPKNDPRLVRKILESFYEISGCPVLVNTSFNVRGEPIVHSPKDAIRCFMTTGIDILVLQNFVVYKKFVDPVLFQNNFQSVVSDD